MPSVREAPRELARLERWFQDQVLVRHEPRVAKKKRAAPASVLLPSKHLAPAERVSIYEGMYLMRLSDCLRSDYGAVEHLLGHARFAALVRAYLERFPSRHWSLNPLGQHVPRFLANPRLRLPRRALLADVARLEWAMQEVFESPEEAPLAPESLAKIPPERWPKAKLTPIAALRLLALDHRANAIVTAVRQEKPLPALGRTKTWVVVYRKNWVLWRMDLDEPRFRVLEALAAGKSLERALASGEKVFRGRPEQLAERVRAAFAEWVSEGFFRAVS